MASRNLTHPWTLDRGVCHLYASGVGAGAANLTSIKGAGISSIAETDTGLYTVTLTDKWNSFMFMGGQVIDPTGTDDWAVQVVSESVASAKTISIAVFKGGTLADLTTDETLKLHIVLNNTSAPPTAR